MMVKVTATDCYPPKHVNPQTILGGSFFQFDVCSLILKLVKKYTDDFDQLSVKSCQCYLICRV